VSRAPNLRTLGVLLTGRAAFRASIVVSAPLLLAAWGPAMFAPYAVAVGTTLVLNPLVGSGTEKSAGTLVPRLDGRPFARRVLAAHLLTAGAIATGSLAGAGLLATLHPDRTVLWLLAGATNIGFGAVQALVAYWRILGVPAVDSACHGVLAAVTVGGLALAVTGTGPATYLALQAATATLMCGALVVALRGRLARPRRRLVRLVTRTTLLMGGNTLLATAPTSVVLAVLGYWAGAAEVSHVYVALAGYTVLANIVDYLLRIYQPWLTTRLRTRPEAVLGPVGRAARRCRDVIAPIAALVVLASASLSGHVGHADSVGLTGALVATAAIAPVLLAVVAVTWVLENGSTATLGWTLQAGLTGLTGTAVLAVLLVPRLAGTGALLAVLAGAVAQLALIVAPLTNAANAANAKNAKNSALDNRSRDDTCRSQPVDTG
jgi:hypothetical protein